MENNKTRVDLTGRNKRKKEDLLQWEIKFYDLFYVKSFSENL